MSQLRFTNANLRFGADAGAVGPTEWTTLRYEDRIVGLGLNNGVRSSVVVTPDPYEVTYNYNALAGNVDGINEGDVDVYAIPYDQAVLQAGLVAVEYRIRILTQWANPDDNAIGHGVIIGAPPVAAGNDSRILALYNGPINSRIGQVFRISDTTTGTTQGIADTLAGHWWPERGGGFENAGQIWVPPNTNPGARQIAGITEPLVLPLYVISWFGNQSGPTGVNSVGAAHDVRYWLRTQT